MQIHRILRAVALTAVLAIVAGASIFGQDLADSEEAQARMQKGISLYQQGQYGPALAEIQIVAERYPTYTVAYRLVGLCQLQLREYDKAAETLRKAVQLSREQDKREDQAARIALGRALVFSGKYEEAIPELALSVKQNPTDGLGFYLLGFANYKLNKEPEAVANLSQAVALNEKDSAALRVLAEIHLSRAANTPEDKALQAKAVAAAQKFKAADPTPEAAEVLGRAYLAARQFTKAVPEFEKAVSSKPGDGLLQFNLGLSLSRGEQFAKAVPVLIRASELLPDNVDVLRELGYVYEKEGKRDKAREVYEKANEKTGGTDEYFKSALERVKQ